jgi:hypothetical protein
MAGMKGWMFAALAASVSAAWAGDPAGSYMLPGDEVKGALTGGADRRMVAFAGVEGSKLSVRVKAAKGSALVPQLELIRPDGALADVGETNPRSRAAAAFRRIELDATGVWRIRLSAATSGGGSYELSASASVPLSGRWKGTITAADVPVDHAIAAAPGGSMSVSVRARHGVPAAPVLELLAPSGTAVGSVTGAKGRARLDDVPLPELGAYVVRVRGEPGDYTVAARVRPARKRSHDFVDVASSPTIVSVSPESATDDSIVGFRADGAGFGPRQTALLIGPGGVAASAAIVSNENTTGAAIMDLTGVAPGAYTFRVSTEDGGCADAPHGVTVTNRAPVAGMIDPPQAWGRNPFECEVRGVGIDAGATIRVLESATGEAVPLEVLESVPNRARVRLSPVQRTTGPCDLEVTDPDGRSNTAPAVLDLLGFVRDPVTLVELETYSFDRLDLWSAAYDEEHGRVLFAVLDSPQKAVFLLCDAATLAIVDTLELATSNAGVLEVAWDGVGNTFALGVTASGASDYAFVRIVSDTDLSQTLSSTTFSGARSIALAAARDTGGYLAVYVVGTASTPDEVRAVTFSAAGTVDGAPARVLGTTSVINPPDVVWRAPGTFLVAFPATYDAELNMGVWAAIADGQGQPVGTPALVASTTDWEITAYVQLAQAPANGPALVNFTFWAYDVQDDLTPHAACVRLAPGSLSAGAPASLSAAIPGVLSGFSFNAVWDPARAEFVTACSLSDGGVLLRRVGPDGTLRSAAVPEHFFGFWPTLYAGSEPGSLGLAVWGFESSNPESVPPLYLFSVTAGPYR